MLKPFFPVGRFRKIALFVAAVVPMSIGSALGQELPSPEDMWQIIQNQQQEIDALKQRVAENETRDVETSQAIEAVADSMDAQAPKVGWWERTSVGGYGELHFNSGVEGKKDMLDFHRYVLFFGHDFNATTRMFSEFELEHSLAGEGKPGEVELEQAYIEHDLSDTLTGRAGVVLIPVGILNEVHEPPTFYGVERNPVEKNIIPTTWWEGGFGGTMTTAGGVQVDALVHGGLGGTKIRALNDDGIATSFKPRDGRQKVANSELDSPAFTTRIRYTGMPGIELAGTIQYQSDLTQGDSATDDASAMLWVAHADINRPLSNALSLGLRALYAAWSIDGSDAEAIGRDSQTGWYVEPSVRMALEGQSSVGLFGRYSTYDNNAGNSADTEVSQYVVGLNYWLHPNAVLKADYESLDAPGKASDKIFNFGVGYQF